MYSGESKEKGPILISSIHTTTTKNIEQLFKKDCGNISLSGPFLVGNKIRFLCFPFMQISFKKSVFFVIFTYTLS